MAFTTTTIAPDPVGSTIISDTDVVASVQVPITSACSMYIIHIDNTTNASTAAYLKIVDAASGVGTGTEDDYRFYAAAGATATYVCETGMPMTAGISYWCTTNPANANTSAPANDVSIKILI